MITQEDIIYFVLTDRFCDGDKKNNEDLDKNDPKRYHGGDFAGIIKKIPYLKNLGITAVWITPVYLSIGSTNHSDGYHGYWAMDFEKIDPHLYSKDPDIADGGKEHLKKLSQQLHSAGIKLILDMVVNHTGYHNDRYQSYPDKKIKDDWFNTCCEGDMIKGSLCGLPDLNCSNVDVVDYFVNNILRWIEQAEIDAIRMDTVKHVEGAFWYFFKSYVKGKYKNITLIGEDLEYDVNTISKYQKDHDFDTLFDFPLCAKIKETFIYNGSMNLIAMPRVSDDERVRGALDMDRDYTNANRLVTLLDNHDLDKRFMSEILDRWGHWDKMRANKIYKLALSFLFTTRGIPQIYYGTEIGMEGYKDPDNRKDMPWEIFGDQNAPFSKYKSEREIFDHTKKLIEIRKENDALTCGYLFTLYSDQYIYSYMREFKGNTIIVVINNGLGEMLYPLPIPIEFNSNIPGRIKKNMRDRNFMENLFDPADKIGLKNGDITVQLSGKEAKIYKLM